MFFLHDYHIMTKVPNHIVCSTEAAHCTSTLSLSRSAARSGLSSATPTPCPRLNCSSLSVETLGVPGHHSSLSSSRTWPREGPSWSVRASLWRRRSCTDPSSRSSGHGGATRAKTDWVHHSHCDLLMTLTNSWFAFVLWAYGVVIYTTNSSFAIVFSHYWFN